MSIGMWLLVIVGGAAGFLSTAYIVVSLIGTLIYKFYRKAKYGISLND